MKVSQVLFLLLQAPFGILASSGINFMDFYDELSGRLACPSPEDFVAENPDFPLECVENSIPPWPLCLFHNVTYFIQGAVASADRCCDFENLDECRCPFKFNPKWQEVMTDWCANIETCPDNVTFTMSGKAADSMMATDVWSGILLEDYVLASLGESEDEDEDEDDEGDFLDDEDIDEYYEE